VVFKKACEMVEYPSEPVVKDLRGGAWWGKSDYKGFDEWGELLPVGVVPP